MFRFASGNLDCIFNSRTTRCALQVTSPGLFVFIVAFGGGQGKLQGGRHTLVLDRHNELRLLWDPGGRVAAWGQAELQGGRGVSDLPCASTWAGVWTALWAGPIYQHPLTREQYYKYTGRCNWNDIRVGSGEPGTAASSPTSALNPNPIFMLFLFQHTCACI